MKSITSANALEHEFNFSSKTLLVQHTQNNLHLIIAVLRLEDDMQWANVPELLKTLPRGEAKLATLTVRERVTASKGNAKGKAKAKSTLEEERDIQKK